MDGISIKDRLLAFLGSQKISQRKFETSIDVSNGYINNLRKTVGADKIYRIHSAYPELNIDWLLTGEGEMLAADKPKPKPEVSYTVGVPYYDEDFMLGFGEFLSMPSGGPEYLINMPGYEKATLWCNASGHSMEPEINNGDIIALKRIDDFSFLPYGDIYGFVTTNGLRTIKRLGRSTHEGYYRLIPTNKEFDEQEIPIDKIALVFRVMGAMKAF